MEGPMRFKAEMDTTTNRMVYRRARKHELENRGLIHCSYCRYHKGENSGPYKKHVAKPKGRGHRD
jgi:hypothetical protein